MVESLRGGRSHLAWAAVHRGLVLASVHTSGYGRRDLAPHTMAWHAMAALWEWWLFTNSPAWHGLIVVVVDYVVMPVSLVTSHDAAV